MGSRSTIAAVLLVLVATASGCGGTPAPGKAAAKIITADWQGAYASGNDPFPSRPDLAGYSKVDSIHCQQKVDAHRQLHCSLVVASGTRSKHLGVIATFDKADVLTDWRFA